MQFKQTVTNDDEINNKQNNLGIHFEYFLSNSKFCIFVRIF